MDLSIHVYHHFPADPSLAARVGKLETHMSQVFDELSAKIDDVAKRMQTEVADLKAHEAALQAQVDAGVITEEQKAELLRKIDEIDPATASTLPPPVVRSPDPEPMPG